MRQELHQVPYLFPCSSSLGCLPSSPAGSCFPWFSFCHWCTHRNSSCCPFTTFASFSSSQALAFPISPLYQQCNATTVLKKPISLPSPLHWKYFWKWNLRHILLQISLIFSLLSEFLFFCAHSQGFLTKPTMKVSCWVFSLLLVKADILLCTFDLY